MAESGLKGQACVELCWAGIVHIVHASIIAQQYVTDKDRSGLELPFRTSIARETCVEMMGASVVEGNSFVDAICGPADQARTDWFPATPNSFSLSCLGGLFRPLIRCSVGGGEFERSQMFRLSAADALLSIRRPLRNSMKRKGEPHPSLPQQTGEGAGESCPSPNGKLCKGLQRGRGLG